MFANAIHLFSCWANNYSILADITQNNKSKYAKIHGYKISSGIQNDLCWDRMRLLRDYLKEISENDFVLWTGCDVIITRMDLKVEQYIKSDYDFICHTGVCSTNVESPFVFGDCFIIKSCDNTINMLDYIYNNKSYSDEQQSISSYLSNLSIEEYETNCGRDFGTVEHYERCERLLNNSKIKVNVIKNLKEKLSGDIAEIHEGTIQPHHNWNENCLVLHMGGKSLEFRCHAFKLYESLSDKETYVKRLKFYYEGKNKKNILFI